MKKIGFFGLLIFWLLCMGVTANAAMLSPAISVMQEDVEMVKTGVGTNTVSFSTEDFASVLGDGDFRGVVIRSLPDPADGVLKLGITDVTEGQTIEKHMLEALRFIPAAQGKTAVFDDHNDRDIYDNVCDRIEKRGHSARKYRFLCVRGVCRVKCLDLLFFVAEGTNNAHTAEIVARVAGQLIELRLYLCKHRNAKKDDREDHDRERGDGKREDYRHFGVGDISHNDRAENDEGRAQKQTQTEVESVLQTVNVGGQTGQQSRCSRFIRGLARKIEGVLEKIAAQCAGESYGCLRGKILRSQRQHHTDSCAEHHQSAHTPNERGIAVHANALVDDLGNQERHEELKQSLRKLHKGRNKSLPSVALCVLP